MKIAICGYAHPFGDGNYYGAERILWYLGRELRERGHEVVFFAVDGCNLLGFEYVKIPKPWDDTIDLYEQAVNQYESEHGMRFDIIHSIQASGKIAESFYNRSGYCLEPMMSFSQFRHNIIAYSHKINDLMDNDGTVVHFGIPEADYREMGDGSGDYLVWIGRMDHGKAPDNALEVARRSGKRIILMGPAYHYPMFIERIWPHIDNDKVIWLSAVNDVIKKRVFKKALAFINPIWERYHEMFGIVNIESLSCGTPIIGWNNASVPSAIGFNGGEIIEEGKQGFIINHNDYGPDQREEAIRLSVQAVNKISQISREDCRNLYLEKFTTRKMVDKLLKYYEILLQRGKVHNVTAEIENG